MPLDREPAQQRHDKQRRQHKLLHRTYSARGHSAPARISVSPDIEKRRSPSPQRSRGSRTESCRESFIHDARLSRPQQRRRMEKRCRSEMCSTRLGCLVAQPSRTTQTEVESALQIVLRLLASIDDTAGRKKADNFLNASLDPPITKHSLSELDIDSIIMENSKLRHDVNFDRELHFRPNLDGAKGRIKRRAQAQYWAALAAELELYSLVFGNTPNLKHDGVSRDQLHQACMRRIPRMFEAIKEVLKVLVPAPDQRAIDEHLDIDMIVQEIQMGMCDLPRIARWLAQTLKAHCAPMRDVMIDKMVKYIDAGVAEQKTESIVEGIVQLFGVMEAMKLDVANHQIRQLRLVLIEDTIGFEQKFHRRRIERQRIDCWSSRLWFLQEASRLEKIRLEEASGDRSAPDNLTIFLSAFLNLVLNPTHERIPDTFSLDGDRLRNIHSDIYELFFIDACESVYIRVAERVVGCRNIPYQRREALRSSVSMVVNQGSYSSIWDEPLDNVVVEILRHVSLLSDKADDLVSEELLRVTKDALWTLFFDYSSPFLPAQCEKVKATLLPIVRHDVERHLKSSPVEIFNTFLPSSTSLPQQRPAPVQPYDSEGLLADTARRLSHIAVLHWRIWAPLVYMNEIDTQNLPSRHLESPVMSRSTSRGSSVPDQFLAGNQSSIGEKNSTSPNINPKPASATAQHAVERTEQATWPVADRNEQSTADDSTSPILYRQRSE